MNKDKKLCSCGMPQSFPIPHEHDLTEREQQIIKAMKMGGEMITKKALSLTNKIYQAYGSSSGYLFGIEPTHRSAVEGIVQSILDFMEKETEDRGIKLEEDDE